MTVPLPRRLCCSSGGPAHRNCHANGVGTGPDVCVAVRVARPTESVTQTGGDVTPTPGEQFGVALPGGTSVSHVRVYDTVGPDGLAGGSPHLHTVCTEAYLVIAGEGAVQTLSGEGYAETPLVAGTIAWFSPGTIHRLINLDGRLELYVVDVERRAPRSRRHDPRVRARPARRRRAPTASIADLPVDGRTTDGAPDAAMRRRDAAVEGFGHWRIAGRGRGARQRSMRCTDERSNCSATGPPTGSTSSPVIRPPNSSGREPRSRSCGPGPARAAERLADSAIRSRSLLPATRNMGCCGTLGTVVH